MATNQNGATLQPILRLSYWRTSAEGWNLAFYAGATHYPLARNLPHHDAARIAACLRRADNAERWRIVEAGRPVTIRRAA